MQDPTAERGRGEVASAISTRTVQVMHEHTGRGPTKARTYINGDTIATFLSDTLTKGERALVERGEEHNVTEMRRAFQRAMRNDLCAEVEKITQRQVIAFFSDNHINPDMAIESFVLAPQPVAENAQQPSV